MPIYVDPFSLNVFINNNLTLLRPPVSAFVSNTAILIYPSHKALLQTTCALKNFHFFFINFVKNVYLKTILYIEFF